MPRVSIGLPVYNGEKYVAEAIGSILGQTFADFELIICDNASTDRTKEICREFVRRDPRVRYYRNFRNLGAARNHNFAFRLAKGEFFKWAAHDDICANKFVEKCVEILDQEPAAVLCHSKVKIIDEKGGPLGTYDLSSLRLASKMPQERFGSLLLDWNHPCYEIFGVMRAEVLARTPLIGRYILSDKNLLGELCLLGQFCEVQEYLFFPRKHPGQSIAREPHARASWFDTSKRRRVIFPYWRILLEYCRSINRVPITANARIGCYTYLFRWLMAKWRFLGGDVRIAVRQCLSSFRSDGSTS